MEASNRMEIISSIDILKERIQCKKQNGFSVGFVPTMGYLHEGHLSLVARAKEENDLVVMSIFVNPLQFGPGEDFERYPRDQKRDKELAEAAGVDIVFFPQIRDMYPEPLKMKVVVHEGVDKLCGQSRPGHFDGVATVVLKLFNIVSPNHAYFGMKDAQQVAVIENLIHDFNIPVNLIRCDTLREEDGLAKSSRNVYLTANERKNAPIIYESLQKARQLIEAGESSPQIIVKNVTEMLQNQSSGVIDYVQLLSFPSLKEISKIEGQTIIAVAVKYSQARLIDNIIIHV